MVAQAEAKISSPPILSRPGLAGLRQSHSGQHQENRHPLPNHTDPRSFAVFVKGRQHIPTLPALSTWAGAGPGFQ